MDRNFGLNCIGSLCHCLEFDLTFDMDSPEAYWRSVQGIKNMFTLKWKILIFLTKIYEQTRLFFCQMFQNWLQEWPAYLFVIFYLTWTNINCYSMQHHCKEMSSQSNVWAVSVGLWRLWCLRHNFYKGFVFTVFLTWFICWNIILLRKKITSFEQQFM